jgi:hypothetical protein
MVTQIRFAFGQTEYIPYSYQYYQTFDPNLYSNQTRTHTTLKNEFIADSLLKPVYDSINGNTTGKNMLLNSHLIDENYGAGSKLYADVLPDLLAGEDFSAKHSVWLTSVGAQLGGDVSNEFHYYLNFFANNGQMPGYFAQYASSTGYISGEGSDRSPGSSTTYWYYSTFLFDYTPVKFLDIQAGKDNNFIGDGYRSVLLSNFAPNYPFFKATVSAGSLQYMIMYAYLANPANTDPVPSPANANKWGYFQYLDWNISNKISVGFFQNTMEATRNTNGEKIGFNPSLAMPFTFLVAQDNIDNNPAKNLVGFTAKYKVFQHTILYGQFALNEFHASDILSGDGAIDNKSAYQIGFRGSDLFGIKNLNYLAEFNTARPFTYSSFDQSSNYSQDGQPLADPFGANFREWVGILNYRVKRFSFQGQINYAYYGLDENGDNYGQNIFQPYTSAYKAYGNYVGQGIRTNFYYAGGNVSYIVNPKNNLRFTLSSFYRETTNVDDNNRAFIFMVGIQSSFRDINFDF